MKNVIETPGKKNIGHVKEDIIKGIMQEDFSDQRKQIFCLKEPLLPFLGHFFKIIFWIYHALISAILFLASTSYFFFSAYSNSIASHSVFLYITENIYKSLVVVVFPEKFLFPLIF